ncbi:TerD family protein, partial [Tychonema sp. BBK16]|uniref:TerD family protein n=2 Tax=Tychonema sp. BBK16 TaxID=2699888 RepID=UPI0038D29E61
VRRLRLHQSVKRKESPCVYAGEYFNIHEAQQRHQNFGQVQNAFVRIVNDQTQQEAVRYDLVEDYSIETALIMAELYRKDGEWRLNAVGSGYQGGLQALLDRYST